MKTNICSSCGIRMDKQGHTNFPCPQCGEGLIGRCWNCRDQSVKYKCLSCGYLGP